MNKLSHITVIMKPTSNRLTVRLLVTSAGTGATELLGLATTRVGDQEGSIILDEDLLDLSLGSLINICIQMNNIHVSNVSNKQYLHHTRAYS